MPEFRSSTNIPLVLVLTWQPHIQPANTIRWIKTTGATRQFHIRRASDVQRVARLLTGRGIGLVLSGGGARGLAHLGVVRALRENGIDIDIVMGTSVGAVIGAGIALELSQESLLEQAQRFCSINLIFELTIPRLSLLAGRRLRSSLHRWFANLQIEDTPIPYACVSTNLNSAELAVHQSGDLRQWIAASMAVPGVFPPVVVDGFVHVDGGVLNNMPSDLIRNNGAGFIIGVDVAEGALPLDSESHRLWPMRPRLNIFELLARVGCIGDEAHSAMRRKHCDVLIAPPLPNIGLLSFNECDRAIEAGYRLTLERLPWLSGRNPAKPSEIVSPQDPTGHLEHTGVDLVRLVGPEELRHRLL